MAKTIEMSKEFKRQFDKRSTDQQRLDLNKIQLLVDNPAHPSLKAHQVESVPGMWECYINRGDRIIYDIQGETLRLWQIGSHAIIDRVNPAAFSEDSAAFQPLVLAESSSDEVAIPPSTAAVIMHDLPESTANLFADVPAAWLQVLRVPRAVVRAVQRATSLEELDSMEGLPPLAKQMLLEVATHPNISRSNASQIIHRTTLDQLTGYVEGKLKRLMLSLTPEQQSYVDYDALGASLLRGCAGSGKTSILIQRAVRLALDGYQVLLVTYSRALAQALASYIEDIVGPLPSTLTVTHLDSWTMTFLTRKGISVQILNDTQRLQNGFQAAIEGSKQAGLEIPNERWTFFRDEIFQVIKGNAIRTFEAYAKWERYGRGRALQLSQRRVVWHIYERYQEWLYEQGLSDWTDPTLRALALLEVDDSTASFDYILIDEAQDLTGAQFRLLQHMVRHDTQGPALFLVGDESQTLYTRGFTWLQGHGGGNG
jgi:mRNA-degrading endonuclease YafQ of YafQ-DinJ toxin-antitoxin module